jgi:hypothetical protein
VAVAQLKAQYDLVVYPASLAGVLVASQAVEAGRSVLLISKEGHPGGAMVDALCCVQTVPEDLGSGVLVDILEQVRSNSASPSESLDSGNWFLHPEALKHTLWQRIDSVGIDLCLHVLPFGIEPGNDSAILKLMGLEGLIELQADHILDCSQHGGLVASIHPGTFTENTTAINTLISGADPIGLDPDWTVTPLAGGDCMFSKTLPNDGSILDESLMALRRDLPASARIKLAPARLFRSRSASPDAEIMKPITWLAGEKNWSPHQQIGAANHIEKRANELL